MAWRSTSPSLLLSCGGRRLAACMAFDRAAAASPRRVLRAAWPGAGTPPGAAACGWSYATQRARAWACNPCGRTALRGPGGVGQRRECFATAPPGQSATAGPAPPSPRPQDGHPPQRPRGDLRHLHHAARVAAEAPGGARARGRGALWGPPLPVQGAAPDGPFAAPAPQHEPRPSALLCPCCACSRPCPCCLGPCMRYPDPPCAAPPCAAYQVLSVQTALSIQSHPDKKLAERLHAANPKVGAALLGRGGGDGAYESRELQRRHRNIMFTGGGCVRSLFAPIGGPPRAARHAATRAAGGCTGRGAAAARAQRGLHWASLPRARPPSTHTDPTAGAGSSLRPAPL